MPDLVVIMSVYKNDKLKYVAESVQSILNQTLINFDYYIVFDGPVSSDIDYYINSIRDKRIVLFRRTHNEGLASALNYLLVHILKKPEYKFIARMDADDVSLPSRFEKQRNFLFVNKEISIVGCWYEEIGKSGNHLSFKKLPLDHKSLRKRYYIRAPFAHPSVMYTRDLIRLAGFYPTDTILMEDNVLWGKAIILGLRLANIPEYLLKFRIDKDFYKRRSGIKYGWNFIKTKFKINKSFKLPVYSYILLIVVGSIKMMPSFVLRYVYMIVRIF